MTTEIKNYAFKNGLPQEFEIVDIAALYLEFRETVTQTHRANFYHIIWFQNGGQTHVVDFNPLQIGPNTLLFLNKDIVQRFDDKAEYAGKAILFTDNFFCKTQNDADFLQSTILFNDLFSVSQIALEKESKIFEDLLQLMTNELQNPTDHSQAAILKNLLHNFLLLSDRERRKQNFTEIKKSIELDYVLLFKDFLEKNYKYQKQVNYYAKQISVSEKRLNLATAKVLGKSPKEIIDYRIVLEAKRLLAHTNKSIKEIGFHLGFEEPTNFIKYFKKHTQFTPTQFRETHSLA